jgi:hypothetical protein
MKSSRLLVLIFLLPTYSFCQKNIDWITHFGSSTPYYGVEQGRYIVPDSEGNIYVAGEFAEAILIDGKTIISNGDKDIFLAKLNSSGKVIWLKNFGGTKGDWCGGICLDENSNVFLTGTFRGKITIEESAFNSASWYDIFLTKINKNGQIIWSKAFIGDGGNSTNAITRDINGYLYLTGYYSQKLYFDNIQLQGPTARSDLFVVKLDEDGNIIWAKSTKSNANNYGNSITSDNNDNLYLTGFMWDSVYFDNHLLVSTNSLNLLQAYVTKMNAITGEFLWAVGGGGDGWSEGKSVAVDNNGDVVLGGWYRNDIFFGNDFLTNGGNDNGPDDIFIAKFDSDGSLKWLNTTRCNLYSTCNDLTINTDNDIFLTGLFRGEILIGDTIYYSTVPSYHDIYVLKLDKNGICKWFKSFGGDSPMNDIGFGIAHLDSNIFITGFYSSNSWFDDRLLNCSGASDIFIVKLSNTEKSIPEAEIGDINIFPNPCSGTLFIDLNNNISSYQIRLLDFTGRELLLKNIINEPFSTVNLSDYSAGMYFLHIHDLNNKTSITKKIIKE